MLRHTQVIYHIKRYAMTNVYISASENMDLLDNLTNTENKLYTLLKSSVLRNPTADFFSTVSLANEIGVSANTLKNAKSALKKKGYALIIKFKDENQSTVVRVVVGKDQVELYNLGVMVEITNTKAYNEMLKQFPITDAKLSDDQRSEMVKKLNEHYLENIGKYK